MSRVHRERRILQFVLDCWLWGLDQDTTEFGPYRLMKNDWSVVITEHHDLDNPGAFPRGKPVYIIMGGMDDWRHYHRKNAGLSARTLLDQLLRIAGFDPESLIRAAALKSPEIEVPPDISPRRDDSGRLETFHIPGSTEA